MLEDLFVGRSAFHLVGRIVVYLGTSDQVRNRIPIGDEVHGSFQWIGIRLEAEHGIGFFRGIFVFPQQAPGLLLDGLK